MQFHMGGPLLKAFNMFDTSCQYFDQIKYDGMGGTYSMRCDMCKTLFGKPEPDI